MGKFSRSTARPMAGRALATVTQPAMGSHMDSPTGNHMDRLGVTCVAFPIWGSLSQGGPDYDAPG